MRALVVAVGFMTLVLSACDQPAHVVPKSSGSIGISHDDLTLYVADADHDRLTLIEAKTGAVLKHVPVGRAPERVLVAPDGAVFVSNRGDRSITKVTADGLVQTSANVGAEPVGMALHPDGRRLLVANSMAGTVTVLDGDTLQPVDEVQVGGQPWAVTVHPDGKRVYLTDFKTGGVKILDLESRVVTANVTLEQPAEAECEWGVVPPRTPAQPADVVLSPDGERAYVAHVQSRTGIETGRQQSLALAVAPALGTINTFSDQHQKEPLNGEPSDYPASFLATNLDANCRTAGSTTGMDAPSSLVVDGRGEWIFVADHNSNAVAVVSATRQEVGQMRDPVRGIYDVVRVGARPTGIAVSGDLRTAYVHNALDYSVSVVKNEGGRLTETVAYFFATSDLPEAVDRGRRLFYSAVDPRVTQPEFGGVSCSSCHPDGRTDGLNWVLPDPQNVDPFSWEPVASRPARNTPALWGVTSTAPYHWDGMLADLPAFSTHMVAQMGGGGLDTTDVADLTAYMATITPPDNPLANVVVDRGQQVFEASCASCHSGTALTDRLAHATTLGDATRLDTPSLTGVFATGPYLHDGSKRALRDVLLVPPFNIQAHDQRFVAPEDLRALEGWLQTR